MERIQGLPVYRPVKAGRFMDRILLELAPEEFKRLIRDVGDRSVVIVSKKSSRFSSITVYKYVMPLNSVLIYCKSSREIELPEDVIVFIVDKLDYPEI